MFVPMLNKGGGEIEPGSATDYSFVIRLLGENKVLSLRKDGYVSMKYVADVDKDIVTETMAASIEFLLPCSSYTITTEEKQIGIVVSKDMPLRVSGFETV